MAISNIPPIPPDKRCTFPGCDAEASAWLAGWPGLQDGPYCSVHAEAAEDDHMLGVCEWCDLEPAVIDLGEGGRLCHECYVANDAEWQARRGP